MKALLFHKFRNICIKTIFWTRKTNCFTIFVLRNFRRKSHSDCEYFIQSHGRVNEGFKYLQEEKANIVISLGCPVYTCVEHLPIYFYFYFTLTEQGRTMLSPNFRTKNSIISVNYMTNNRVAESEPLFCLEPSSLRLFQA